jgi:branched-chain amino acid aminotransferase
LLPADTPVVSVGSRAFRYGYGLFETMLMHEGRIRLEALHWERLRDGMKALGISAAPDFFQKMQEAVRHTLRSNGHETLARLRLQVWPGTGGYTDAADFNADFCIESFALPVSVLRLQEEGLVAGIASGIVKCADAFSHLKSCNALPYALAARQARASGWDEALLLNQHGRIADGSIANVFWMKAGKIFTPPLSEGCVAGVMRRHLLEYLPAAGYDVEEAVVAPEVLQSADGMFLSNALRGIRWVKDCAGHCMPPGKALELQAKLLMSF